MTPPLTDARNAVLEVIRDKIGWIDPLATMEDAVPHIIAAVLDNLPREAMEAAVLAVSWDGSWIQQYVLDALRREATEHVNAAVAAAKREILG